MEFRSDLTGLEDVLTVFQNLPRSSQRKAYYPSLRAGGEVVKDAAADNLKRVSEPFTGLATKSNTLRVYNLKKFKGAFRVAVQARRGLVNPAKRNREGQPARVGMYLAVMEYGSQKLNRRPRPWIRPAIKTERDQAVNEVRKTFSSKIDEILKDARKP